MNYYNIDELGTNIRSLMTAYGVNNYNMLRMHHVDHVHRGPKIIFGTRPSYRRTKYNWFTRGLVTSITSRINSVPVPRIFDHRDRGAEAIDLQHAEMIEKLDGVAVGCFFDHRMSPVFHNQEHIGLDPQAANAQDRNGYKIHLASDYFARMKSIPEDFAKRSFTFEIIDQHTRRTTIYMPENYGIYLVGGRCLESLEELSEDELDLIAPILGAKRPLRRPMPGGFPAVYEFLQDKTPDYEGVILRTRGRNGIRVKVHKRSYLSTKWKLGAGKIDERHLLNAWLHGDRTELELQFPDVGRLLNKLDTELYQIGDYLAGMIRHWQRVKTSHEAKIDQMRNCLPPWARTIAIPLLDYSVSDVDLEIMRDIRRRDIYEVEAIFEGFRTNISYG